jgi:hypothetical protein
MLRRRSHSTPTDDLELTAQTPVGVVSADTSEELVLAAVDGELVNRALDRLSTRHRHVLAMREGSGWTYQQIADHEGVEIGTIETLLWRARQALKREFAVVSDSKEALAGFLIATGALIRRTIFRAAHRGASVHHVGGGSGSGAVRNAVAGVAVTGAAVAAAFIAPHALSSGPSSAASVPGFGSALASPPLVLGADSGGGGGGGPLGPQTLALGPTFAGSGGGLGTGSSSGGSSGSGGSGGGGNGSGGVTSLLGGSLGGQSGSSGTGLTGGLNQAAGGLNNTVNGATGGISQTVSGVTQTVGGDVGGLTNTVGGVTGGVTQTVGGVVGGVTQTVGGVVGGVTSGVSGGSSGTSGVTGTVGGVTGGVTGGVNGITQSIGLGSVLPGSSGSGSSNSSSGSSASTPTTTTTTNPVQGIVGGTTKTLGGLLGG